MLNQSAALDRVFRAFADPTRRAMIARLAAGEASVSELGQPFAMSLPAVHQHLRLLEQAGVVTTAKRGRIRTCRLNPTALRRAEEWLGQRRLMWERRLDALGAYLANDARARPRRGGAS